MRKDNHGFTLIELLVVIAIIGILSTMAIIALGNARTKARDSKRVADLKQIATALELYYSDNGSYPLIITPGQSIASPDGSTVYMKDIPANPTPRNDGACPDTNYGYIDVASINSYYLYSCLGSKVGNLTAGSITYKPGGQSTNEPLSGLVGWWKFDEGSGTTALDSTGNNNNGTWHGSIDYYDVRKTGDYAGKLNGTDNYVSIADSPTTRIKKGSFSLWIKAASWTSPISRAYWVDFSSHNFLLLTDSSSVGYFYAITDAGAFSNTFVPPSLNVWHLFTVTYDGSIVKLYIDGSAVANTSAHGEIPSYSGAGNMRIGDYVFDSLNTYVADGLIDDVRLYNRALSADEALALYDATK